VITPVGQHLFDLKGKVAMVTGGNSGIGLAIAIGLASAGAEVCIWGRNRPRNAAALKTLERIAPRALALECDVTDETMVRMNLERTVTELGKVDICFANAGFFPSATRLSETTKSGWHDVLAVDLDGAFFVVREAVRHMRPRRTGSICLVSSLAALYGVPRRAAYGAAKAAVLSLARSAAVELAQDGIRVNAILPGWIDTPLLDDFIRSQDPDVTTWREAVLARIPARRWGRPEDIVGIAIYLASDASAYHTGDALVIDGGYSVS
jgi:NAD(P)-dependent dehydrogenase (short-subunit alcohol dehydrogenase family)